MYERKVTFHSAASATATGTVMNTTQVASVLVQITGTFSATVTFQGTVDGSTWVAVQGVNLNDGSVATTATAAGLYLVPMAGARKFRCDLTWASGTSITVTGIGTDRAGSVDLADTDVTLSGDVSIQTNTAKDGSGTDYQPIVDSDGHLQMDVLSIAAGANNIGDVDVASIAAGSNIIGKVGIDQTTPGTTNRVDIGNIANTTQTNDLKVTLDSEAVVLGASSANVGDVDVLTVPGALQGPGNPTVDSYSSAVVNLAASTANQVLVATPGASKQIWVYGLFMMADTAAGTVTLQDEDDTALSGTMAVSDEGGWVLPMSGNFAMPWIKVATNKALEADTGACTVDGIITYAIVSV